MEGTLDRIESPELDRPIHVWRYGHFGLPVLVFPSASGMAHEWQKEGMIDVIAPLLAAGKVKLYCVESNVSEAWTRKETPIDWRMDRHHRYERWVLDRMVPYIRKDCRWPDAPITTVGCSLGGTYAVNFALKFPEVFRRGMGFSGRYLTSEVAGKHSSTGLYFNNPLAYMSNIGGDALERVRRNTKLTLVCGRGKWEEGCIEETIALGELMDRIGVPNDTDIWGYESYHDWPWWRLQVAHHFGRIFG